MNPQIIKKGSIIYLHIDGFLYVRSDSRGDVTYWKCRKRDKCPARVTTVKTGRNSYIVRKGGSPKSHEHGPDPEEAQALEIMGNIKRDAVQNPERPPSAVMRVIQGVPRAVQARLPEIDNIKKTIQRQRTIDLPTNPTNIKDLGGCL